MKRIVLSAWLLILVGSVALAQPAAWKRYTVKGEAFSVILPTLPAMATTKEYVDRFGNRAVSESSALTQMAWFIQLAVP